LKTDAHFPTDISSICFDAVRKTTETVSTLCDGLGISGWREAKSNQALNNSISVRDLNQARGIYE
jgi:hypothetical protein